MRHWNGQPWFTETRITRTCTSSFVAARQADRFVFDRQYVQHAIRRHAESAYTLQLGYRTSLDREEAERREVSQARFTSLDRVLARDKPPDAKPGSRFEVSRRPDAPELSESGRAREQRLVARLHYLADAGLAQATAPLTWSVDADFERTLRAFQRAQDRQRMMAQHAAFLSDPRLQYRVVSPHAGPDIVMCRNLFPRHCHELLPQISQNLARSMRTCSRGQQLPRWDRILDRIGKRYPSPPWAETATRNARPKAAGRSSHFIAQGLRSGGSPKKWGF